MRKLFDALVGVGRLGLDTVAIIYFLEEHPSYIERVDQIFQHIDQGVIQAITSMVSLTEVLIHPIRLGDTALRQSYRVLLLRSRNFRTLPVNAAITERAAELRVRHGLRTPDALQVATALETRCDAFLTNDLRLQRVTDLRVLVLEELEL